MLTQTKLADVIAEQEAIFVKRQPKSAALADRASEVLAGGVTSNWQITQPQPVWLSHGAGSKVYDADGNEYVDLHGGYGAGLAGHAHPAIVRAVKAQVERGTHFAQPTENAIVVAGELVRRWGLPRWRFANSGTEATMDAVHLMRSYTGRDLIIKVEGGYHGHHDSVQVSVMPDEDEAGPRESPSQVPSSTGIPEAITRLTLIAQFNDLASVARLLDAHRGQVAGMIVEPVMMNAGIILPLPGYLAGLADLLHSHGALLTFDEVKTGLTVGPGGVTGQSGVIPDLVCLAKSLGGGVAVAAIGGTPAADGPRGQRRLRNGRHVQRQPPRDGRGPRDADRGRHGKGIPANRGPAPARGRRHRRRDQGLFAERERGDRRRQRLRRLRAGTGPRLPRLPHRRRLAQPRALAVPAQRRGVPPAVGQDRAVADLRPAR